MKPASLPNIRIVYRGQTDHKNQELRYHPNFEEQRNNSQVYDFKNKLDFRDEVIRVPLKIKKEDQVLNSSFQPIILNWLAQMVENILSASFRQILSQNLTVLQSKAYASKNILLNIKQTCVQINRVCKTEIDIPFMQFLDQSLQEIISEIINKYPQQNTKGASRKVNDFIKKISSRQNDEYDFLYKNNITIRYNPTGDYSQDIMKIINKIINIPQQIAKKVNQNSNTNRKDVLFQEFHSFCSNLFFMSNKQISENNLRYSTVNYAPQITSRWQFKNLNEDVEHNINNTLEGKKSIKFEHIVPDFNEQQLRIDISESHAQKLIEARSQITQQFLKFEEKKGQFYAICQKIPSEVKTFDQKEIRSGHFRVYHASISRVLTKWAQSLYEKFESASQKIRYRLFKFKTNEKKISYNDFQIGETKLRYCQVEEKEFLYQAVINRKIKVDEYMDYLKRKNKNLQAVLSSQYLEGTYLKKFTDVGIFAGRTQEILNQMTFSYLNYLIHSLLLVSLEASENIFQNYRIYEDNISKAEQKKCALSGINLVNFNVGDLLRARYICLEHEFINVLAFLYKIEEMNPLFLKIVKIKNRLDDNNNDILINFFFKNAITCELQLAIFKETNKKEKLYSQFNHFLYELKRSSFGVISALSNVIAQHDPIVNYFTFSKMKHPKLIKSTKNTTFKDGQVVKENFFQKFFMYKNNRQRIIDKPFICSECKLLRIVHNTKFYERNQELQSVCNSCIEKRLNISTCSLQSSNISHQILLLMSSLFRYYIMDQKILEFIKQIKLWSPTQELKDVKDQTELYARFLQYGFIIQKDEKLPKVRFFKKFYNPMKNIMILSTVMGGRVSNFLRLDCKKNGASMILMSQLAKFLVFSLKNMQQQHFKDLVEQNYISQENQEANFLDVLKLKHRQILKIEYITQIESSFDKNYSTLYLNNYKFALDYLEEYIHIQGQTYCGASSSLKKKALCVTNLELQSCQISLLKCVLSEFVNLKQLNISSNSIRDIKVLQKLTQLQVINVSHNKVTSIKPVYELKELVVIVASDNIISQLQLQDFHLIVKLLKLDCSRNSITRLKGIEALQNIKSLVLQHNFIEQMSGIRSLHYLQKLLLNNNKLQQIVGIECLQNLKELDLSQNQKIRDFPLINNQYKLATLNISGNFLTAITPMLCKNLKILNLSKNKIQKIENLDSLMQLQELDLSLNHIHRIQNLQDLLKLKILLLQSNKITVIENLEKLKMLQKVVISFNPIKQTTSLNHLKYLSHLDIEHCEIEAIRELNKLKRIKTLDLSNNKIKKIFQIDELVRIQNLDLGDNKITKIENLQYLKYLQSLSLMNNHITKIQNLGELTQLQWIILSGNKIRKLQHLEGLESLHILQIEKNSIQKIENLETLVDLSELWLSDNRITHISGLEKLEKLKRLGLAKNNISKVEGLKELHNLQFLDLQGNQLTQLENLDCLGSLKWLVASVNNIKKIDGLSQLWKLQTLFLEHNQITVIQNLNKLTRLTYLKLEFNKIAKISGLNYLENLEKLYLECNEIAKIEGLQNLYKLNELILKNNYIAKIQNLQHLTNLQFLDLSYNSIQKHENLEDLRCLKRLYLQNNKIEMLNSLDFPVIMEEVKNISDSPSQLTSWETKNRIKFNLGALLRRFEQDSQTHSQEKPQEGETDNNGEDQRGKEVINVCKPDVPEAMKMTIQKNVVSPRYLASEASQKQNETLKARQKFVHNFTKKLNTRIL